MLLKIRLLKTKKFVDFLFLKLSGNMLFKLTYKILIVM